MTDTGVKLYIMPRKVMTWEGFKNIMPRYSIALDGFVADKTKRDTKGPYANFDHHTEVDRLSTRSTSEQVNMEIRTGLFDTFRENGLSRANVYVNDPDEDTELAWWQLEHHEEVRHSSNPKINRLVWCEDRLDCTGGMYPLGEADMRRKMAWMFEPYQRARFERKVSTMNEPEMRSLFTEVGKRIDRYVFGDGGEELPIDGSYKKIGSGTGWSLVEETSPAARMAMANDGIKAYISIVDRKVDGSNVVVMGRTSPWVYTFPKKILCDKLNDAEGDIITEANRWDGGDLIWGSPKITGSRLPISTLEKITEDTVLEQLRG